MGEGTRIPVRLGDRAYEVRVGAGLLPRTGEALRDLAPAGPAFVVTDANVAALHLEPVLESLVAAGFTADPFVLPPGEEAKTIDTVRGLWSRLLEIGADRTTPVVALGGGVVTDLAGFAAATFLRGVPWLAVPTSLLAQVDASVGGKTGVNRPEGKNLVGSFHQPAGVLADVAALATLPGRHFVNGLAEVVKVGLGLSAELFLSLERDGARLLAGEADVLEKIVAAAVREKARIVEEDEREGDRRRLLNLGHTFGHAIEAATGFGPVLHGEAVAVGLVAAAEVAVRRGRLGPEERERIRLLIRALGLPASVEDLAVRPGPDEIRTRLRADKKRTGDRLALVLPTAIGGSEIVPDGTPDEVVGALFDG